MGGMRVTERFVSLRTRTTVKLAPVRSWTEFVDRDVELERRYFNAHEIDGSKRAGLYTRGVVESPSLRRSIGAEGLFASRQRCTRIIGDTRRQIRR